MHRELLQDSEIQSLSDWGSSGRRFESYQPDQSPSSSNAGSERSGTASFITPRGTYSKRYSNPVAVGSRADRARPCKRALSSGLGVRGKHAPERKPVKIETNPKSDGMVWVRIHGGTEFAVHPSRWNDPKQRQSIIAAETNGTRAAVVG